MPLVVEPLEPREVPAADLWAVGSGPGVPAVARLLNADNSARFEVAPFGTDFTGGLTVAAADTTGDGVADLIAAAGPGGGPAVRVFDGVSGQPVRSFFAFDATFTGGLTVAAADVNRDRVADIVVGAGLGGGPVVKVFDGASGAEIGSFLAFAADFRGGVDVAAADLDGDDRADVVAGAGVGGGPHVRTFRADGTPLQSFFAYDAAFRGGVNVTAGSLDGRTAADVVTAAGPGGAPHVRVFDGTTAADRGGFFAGSSAGRAGADVGVRYTPNRLGGLICAAVGGTVRDFDGTSFAPMSEAVSGATVGTAPAAVGDPVLEWTGSLLLSIKRTTTLPPQAARAMAVVSTAVFDAVNSIAGGFEPYLTRVPAPAGASAEAAAAAAAARALTALFPTRAAGFQAQLAADLATLPGTQQAKDDGVAVGNAAADAILAARQNDGASNSVVYTPRSGPYQWQPTPPANAPAFAAQWPNVTPWAMESGDQFRPAVPPAIDGTQYAAELAEVQRLGRKESADRTAEQTLVARFWADAAGATSTPPGHWFEIARRVSRERGLTLAENARLFALLGVALADAAIVSWDAKYLYTTWRPVTAVRGADADGNPLTAADAAWEPLLTTPNFPAYTSGHSTFSAAAAAVLGAVFGPDVGFDTASDGVPGAVRAFPSFRAAAEEAGRSRIFGGIHVQADNRAGLDSGRRLGEFVAGSLLGAV